MDYQVSQSLQDFTRRYLHHWQSLTGNPPASRALYGVPSPCVVSEDDSRVFWQPRQPQEALTLAGVERAMEMRLRPEAWAFYCTQLAGDMTVSHQGQSLELLQVWSEADGVRIQENLIGHLLMQKRLKIAPSVFIATTDSELNLVSLSNLTGEVLLEEVGRKKNTVLAPTLQDFLSRLVPCVT